MICFGEVNFELQFQIWDKIFEPRNVVLDSKIPTSLFSNQELLFELGYLNLKLGFNLWFFDPINFEEGLQVPNRALTVQILNVRMICGVFNLGAWNFEVKFELVTVTCVTVHCHLTSTWNLLGKSTFQIYFKHLLQKSAFQIYLKHLRQKSTSNI